VNYKVKDFLQALSFLSILPAEKILPFALDGKELSRSMAFFSLVGLLIGLLLASGFYLFSLLLPRSLVLWLTIGLLAFLTRGLHLDGFADTMDGLASGGSKERILEVMKDSRVGAFGVFSLIFLIGAKYLALDQIPDSSISSSLVLMTVLGRNSMVLVCFRSPYARTDNGLGKLFTDHLGFREVIFSSLLALGVTLIIVGIRGILIFLIILLFSFGYRFYFIKRVGGVTGDILGASNEFVELLSIVLLIILEKI